MNGTGRGLVAAALLVALAGCGQVVITDSNTDRTAAHEEQQTAAFKKQYKDVVLGVEARGSRLDVFIDVEHMSSMDEQAELDMKDRILTRWQAVWKANHPGRHALLRVRLRDYFGNTVYTKTARV